MTFYGAGDEARTRYLHLGKVALYQMSYTRSDLIIIHHNNVFVKRKNCETEKRAAAGRACCRCDGSNEQTGSPSYLTAMHSTSSRAPMGRAATWKQERAGTSPLKYSA